MSFGGGGGAAPPPPPPIPPPPPALNSPQGAAASDSAQRRARQAYGGFATNLTGPLGLTTPASTAQVTLLGGPP